MDNPAPIRLRDVEVDGRRVDVDVEAGVIRAIRPHPGAADRPVANRLATPATANPDVIDGGGGALLPGLHDHHLHLFATAAAATSVEVGPPAVANRDEFEHTLSAADEATSVDRWLRAVGYHESVAGDLDRRDLDRIVADRPLRVQHRSGARWTLNSAAIDALALDDATHSGIERDAAGRATGRLDRADDWLRDRLPPTTAPDLADLGHRLARYGITGVTDTSPSTRGGDHDAIANAVNTGALPQRVMVTGGVALADRPTPSGLERGPVKFIIDEHRDPLLDELAAGIAAAHNLGRAVAIHCVTRAALVLALTAWDDIGARDGDRVEHAAVVPSELRDGLVRHGVTVVTQPAFIAERGDEYRRDVDPADLPYLYPAASLLAAGIPLAASSDAPYTNLDPWRAMRGAVSRAARTGEVLGADEAISPARALQLYLGDLQYPGGPPRVIGVGAPADLCLLRHPLATTLERLTADDVIATVIGGRLVHRAE